MEPRPLVTVAVPLYRSARFVDNIAGNLARTDYPALEILISDRHGEDDALGQLADRLAGDPRVRLLTATDRIGWVAHYNLLLREGRGTYFLWMPHDDIYPAGYISQLVSCLEAHPESILAFGRLEAVDEQGVSQHWLPPPPLAPAERWSWRVVLRLLLLWNLGIPFRGVFRRQAVLDAGLYIRPLRGSVHADTYWVLALALRAPLRYVPACVNQKRYYAGSVHADWPSRVSAAHFLDAAPVVRAYVHAAAASGAWRTRMGAPLLAGAFLLAAVPGIRAARSWVNERRERRRQRGHGP